VQANFEYVGSKTSEIAVW